MAPRHQALAGKAGISKRAVDGARTQRQQGVRGGKPTSGSRARSQPVAARAAPAESGTLELTPENVEHVLDEVRPYLVADGGEVEVADVDALTVYLRLKGACGSCPSSAMTLKMGIERRYAETQFFILLASLHGTSQLTNRVPLPDMLPGFLCMAALLQQVEGAHPRD